MRVFARCWHCWHGPSPPCTRFWLLSLPAVKFSPGCMPAAAARKVPLMRGTFSVQLYGQYRGTKGWVLYHASRAYSKMARLYAAR
jgi:hypothetical protein